MAVDESGKEYYYKENSQESLWELPEVCSSFSSHQLVTHKNWWPMHTPSLAAALWSSH